MTKTCKKCVVALPLSEFTSSGKYTYCRSCTAAKTREWYKAHGQAAKERWYKRRKALITSGRCACNKEKLAAGRKKCEQCLAYLRSPEWLASRKVSRASLKAEVFSKYGGYRCTCCEETVEKFLSIDHINNDGATHRKSIGRRLGSDAFYRWLKRNGFPDGFQVLCFNCNIGKHLNGGVCPHKRVFA